MSLPSRRLVASLGAALLFAGVAAAEPKPLLWKITSPDAAADSWLFGTIHLPRPEFSKLPPPVEQAFKSAGAVYTEIPMDLGTMLGIAPRMMLPRGETLDQKLSAEEMAALKAELAEISPDLTIEPLKRFKPWALAASLMLLGDQMKYPGTLAMDTILFQRAAMAGKKTGGIETPDEQFAVFEDFDEAEQMTMLADTIEQMRAAREKGESPADTLAQLYLEGDVAKLMDELNKWTTQTSDSQLMEAFMERLLYRRNSIMAERIAGLLREHPKTSYFFAIGTGHLGGDRGVLALLEKAGFGLTRIP